MRQVKTGQTFLLIVLVIVGIASMLLLLLLPTTVSIQEAEKRLICLKNLKNIGQALQMYAVDFNGYLPLEANSSNLLWDGTRRLKVNLGQLYPGYLKQPQKSWYCPAQRYYRESHPDFGFTAFGVAGKKAYGSYFVRGALQFDESLTPDSPFLPTSYPEKIAWVADYNIPDSEVCAHKGRGVFVLLKDGSVHFASGTYSSSSPADPYGQLFWKSLDSRFASRVQTTEKTSPETTTAP